MCNSRFDLLRKKLKKFVEFLRYKEVINHRNTKNQSKTLLKNVYELGELSINNKALSPKTEILYKMFNVV